jgi:hypothetical protein
VVEGFGGLGPGLVQMELDVLRVTLGMVPIPDHVTKGVSGAPEKMGFVSVLGLSLQNEKGRVQLPKVPDRNVHFSLAPVRVLVPYTLGIHQRLPE